MHRLSTYILAICALLFTASPAAAAGGAHVVDDTSVETPGRCHIESWAARIGPGGLQLNMGLGCTPAAAPRLELDMAVQYLRADGLDDTAVSPGLKVALADLGHGVSLAIKASATWGTRQGTETANVTVPLTIAAGREVELNLNLGWEWNRTGAAASRAFWGGQVVWSPSPVLSLMAEGFGYSDGIAGWQAGVRWTPVAWLDLDLLGGRLDTASRHVLTLGVTTRF